MRGGSFGVQERANQPKNSNEKSENEKAAFTKQNARLCGLILAGAKAEGKGFEPSTGFPAPDFESGS